ncbi:MAG: GtrA family protein [Intrasporangiaceae bacterium]|nr:GtrA family protein [Intrasporangiaceae bacterium]
MEGSAGGRDQRSRGPRIVSRRLRACFRLRWVGASVPSRPCRAPACGDQPDLSRDDQVRGVLFFGVNAIALAIAAGILALSHYGLGFQTRLADNIATIIGIGIGTIFRFVAYRSFVFAGVLPPQDDAAGLLRPTRPAPR